MTNAQSNCNRDRFQAIANAHGTDKCRTHGYHRYYPLFLASLDPYSEFTIVEVGYGSGNSIHIWKELFPKSYYVCIDKDVCEKGEGYTVLKADQESPSDIEATIESIPGPVRLILDDGSHHPRHQLSTFSIFFMKLLEPGGLYFIEDIETSYWLAGQLYGNTMRFGLFSRWSAIEALKLAVDYTNRTFLSEEDKNLLQYSLLMTGLSPEACECINMISFGQNCTIITKSLLDDLKYLNRDYPYLPFTQRF